MQVGVGDPEFHVRRAGLEHVTGILALLEAVAAERRWIGTEPPVDRSALLRHLRSSVEGDARTARFVALGGEEVIGQLSMELKPSGVAELGMFVAPAWRGQGVGGALVDAGLAWARQAGAHKVALQMWPHNHAARALYDKFGFVEEGRLRRHYRRRNGQLWDAVMMGLVLDEESPGSPYDG